MPIQSRGGGTLSSANVSSVDAKSNYGRELRGVAPLNSDFLAPEKWIGKTHVSEPNLLQEEYPRGTQREHLRDMRWYKRRMFGTGSVIREVIRTFEQHFESSGRSHGMLLVAECRDPVDWIVWMRIPDALYLTSFLWFEAADENRLPGELKKLGGSDSGFQSLLAWMAARRQPGFDAV